MAVDLPSGIDADTGEVAGAAVRADVTITFGTLKPGLLIDPGARTRESCNSWTSAWGGYLARPTSRRPRRPNRGRAAPPVGGIG